MDKAPRIKKESKNKIRVEFERAPLWERLKAKFFSINFLKNVIYVIFRTVLLIGVSFVILSPYLQKIFGSIKSVSDFSNPKVVLISANPTFEQYSMLFKDTSYFSSLFKTIIISATVALIETVICALVAYGLAKFKFKGNNIVFMLVVATLMIPRETLQYATTQFISNFGESNPIGLFLSNYVQSYSDEWLRNSFFIRYLYSFLGLGFKDGLFIFMLRQFFRGVPDELEESAYVDGCNAFKTFFRIIVPISIPMLVTVFIFGFSWQWTDSFYTNLLFDTEGNPGTLSSIANDLGNLKQFIAIRDGNIRLLYKNTVQGTLTILIAFPLIIMYCFLQNKIVQGVERSGIVG